MNVHTAHDDHMIDIISQIEPEKIAKFIVSIGWSVESNDHVYELIDPSGDSLYISKNLHSNSYAKSVYSLFESLCDEDLYVDDLIQMTVLGSLHIVRNHVADSTTRWGAMPVGKLSSMLQNFASVLKFSAAGFVSGQNQYTNIPKNAHSYTKMCMFGQTEIGSYKVKLYCPTELHEPGVIESAEGFGTDVVDTLFENVNHVSSGTDQDRPRTLNANFASALANIAGESLYSTNKISVKYFKKSDESRSIELSPSTARSAQKYSKTLRKEHKLEIHNFVGYITDLHRDRPAVGKKKNTDDRKINRSVTLDVRFDGAWRRLNVPLLPNEYKMAVTWHDEVREVFIRGKLNRNRSPWVVTDLKEMHPMGDEIRNLFTLPSE